MPLKLMISETDAVPNICKIMPLYTIMHTKVPGTIMHISKVPGTIMHISKYPVPSCTSVSTRYQGPETD